MPRALGLLLALLIGLCAAPARAAGAAPSQEDRDAAERLRAAGDRHYQAGDYAGARAEYQEAYAHFPSPMLLVALAAASDRCGAACGGPREALRALLRFFAAPGDSPEVVHRTAETLAVDLAGRLDATERAALVKEAQDLLGAAAWARFPERVRALLPRPPAEAMAPPAPAPVSAPAAPMALLPPARPERHRLRVAKWVLGSLGVLSGAAGATLLALQGRCGSSFTADGATLCKATYNTQAGGAVLVAVGGAALGTSALFFGLDARRPAPPRAGEPAVALIAGGRF